MTLEKIITNTYNITKGEVLDRCKKDKTFREEMINCGILVPVEESYYSYYL